MTRYELHKQLKVKEEEIHRLRLELISVKGELADQLSIEWKRAQAKSPSKSPKLDKVLLDLFRLRPDGNYKRLQPWEKQVTK